MAKNDGGSAFPNDGAWANGYPEGGMSLRDYFAGQALASLPENQAAQFKGCVNAAARFCYKMADAMLAESAKGEENG